MLGRGGLRVARMLLLIRLPLLLVGGALPLLGDALIMGGRVVLSLAVAGLLLLGRAIAFGGCTGIVSGGVLFRLAVAGLLLLGGAITFGGYAGIVSGSVVLRLAVVGLLLLSGAIAFGGCAGIVSGGVVLRLAVVRFAVGGGSRIVRGGVFLRLAVVNLLVVGETIALGGHPLVVRRIMGADALIVCRLLCGDAPLLVGHAGIMHGVMGSNVLIVKHLLLAGMLVMQRVVLGYMLVVSGFVIVRCPLGVLDLGLVEAMNLFERGCTAHVGVDDAGTTIALDFGVGDATIDDAVVHDGDVGDVGGAVDDRHVAFDAAGSGRSIRGRRCSARRRRRSCLRGYRCNFVIGDHDAIDGFRRQRRPAAIATARAPGDPCGAPRRPGTQTQP